MAYERPCRSAPPRPPGRSTGRRRWPSAPPLRARLGLVAVVLLGAWLGLLVVGSVRAPGRPHGHHDDAAPLPHRRHEDQRLPARRPRTAQPRRARSASTSTSTSSTRTAPQALVDHPERLSGLQDEVTADVAAGTARPRRALLRRRRRPAPPRSASPSTAARAAPSPPAASPWRCWPPPAATAYATWNPKSVLEPKFSGLLSARPLGRRQRPQHRQRIRRLPAGVGPPGHQRDQAVRRRRPPCPPTSPTRPRSGSCTSPTSISTRPPGRSSRRWSSSTRST